LPSILTLLLGERRRFAGQVLAENVAKLLGRADTLNHAAGEQAQLNRYISILPRGWPMAAIMRQHDVGDAANYRWLRADPAHVRAEMGVARLLSIGDRSLTQAEADALIKPLKILFGDSGFLLSAPVPDRWYLMLPKESKVPEFKAPIDAIGADIFSTMPHDDVARRWHALLNEAQIILHNHPVNAARITKSQLPMNSLYFWGGGILPDQVSFSVDAVISDDIEVQALAKMANVATRMAENGSALIDLRRVRDWKKIESEYFLPNHATLNQRYSRIVLDFADGTQLSLQKSQKWRFWRSAWRSFA
jgi:hypothetical protein